MEVEDGESSDGGGSRRNPETLESKTFLQELPKEGPSSSLGLEGQKEGLSKESSSFDGPSEGTFFGPMPDSFGSPECLDKRCNPFKTRRHRPSYYKRFLEGPSGPRPYGPPGDGYYNHHSKQKYSNRNLPEYTEIIIIRKVPIMLSKLLVIAQANAKDYKKPDEGGKVPDYPNYPPPDPVLYKKGGESSIVPPGKSGDVPPEIGDLEGQLTLQKDQPTVEFGNEDRKGKPKYNPEKDGAFESLMGTEEMVSLPAKDGLKTKDSSKIAEGTKRQTVKEYLERPGGPLERNELARSNANEGEGTGEGRQQLPNEE